MVDAIEDVVSFTSATIPVYKDQQFPPDENLFQLYIFALVLKFY